MKKGKRQVLNTNAFAEEQQPNNHQDIDQRKKKIQMMKEKYLNKNNKDATQHPKQQPTHIPQQQHRHTPHQQHPSHHQHQRPTHQTPNQPLMKRILEKKIQQTTTYNPPTTDPLTYTDPLTSTDPPTSTDPFQLKGYYPATNYQPQPHSNSQYSTTQQQQPLHQYHTSPNIKQALMEYLHNNSHQVFDHLFPNNPAYSLQPTTPSLSSTNQELSSNSKRILLSFAIHNQVAYSQQQKQTIYDIILQYYFTNANLLPDVFLVFLVKLGKEYLSKYTINFRKNMTSHLQAIVKYTHLFIQTQVDELCQFISSQHLTEQCLLLALMINRKSQAILKKIYSAEITRLEYALAILTLLQPKKQNILQLTIYCKLITTLIKTAQQTGIIEQLLTHHKQLQFPEKLYNLNKTVLNQIIQHISQEEKPTQPPTKPTQNIGLLGYFNKAIDKIKTNVVSNIVPTNQEESKAKQEPEQKLTYDPLLKRYLINGEVPKDETPTIQQQESKKLVPPPPPSRGKQVPPPPPGVKKTRIITNRYS